MAKRTYKRRTTTPKPKLETISIEDAPVTDESIEEEVLFQPKPIIKKEEPDAPKGLSVGASGGIVRSMQETIGHESHGKFDESTRARLQYWQKKKGLTVTGVLDDATKVKMGI